MYPWEDPNAPEHVRTRQPVCELPGSPGVRADLPRRRPPDELPLALQQQSFGIAIMCHRGYSNGRLSVLLSSIPENYPVVVSSDSIAAHDVEGDRTVCEHHGARFEHATPWGGRAANAIHTMRVAPWDLVLYLCDDVWLFPECVRDALGWFHRIREAGVRNLATLGVPGWHTRDEHPQWGFTSWAECLEKPWMFDAVPPNPAFRMCPALFVNPFGACMVINRRAYEELGGFTEKYWAHDDVWCHQVWLSNRWVNAAYPGRGYMHYGGQSWHHGESVDYVRTFDYATGMSAEESGRRQRESLVRWRETLAPVFLKLGGTPSV